MNHPRVVICQRRLTHYRVPFFEQLRSALANRQIDLQLVVGQPAPDEADKRDSGDLAWATTVVNRYWVISGIRVCWQPFPRHLKEADLVVVTQENSLLSNYPLLLRTGARPRRVALWGHGANFQARGRKRNRERLRTWATRRAHWWFAYTEASVGAIAATGFPRERTTNVENAIDTTALKAELENVTKQDSEQLRLQLRVNAGSTGLFLGSLYADRRLDLLLDAARQLHATDPKFRLVIVGDGPGARYIKEACIANPWCIWVGALSGADKARHLAVADVMLHPGALGLGVLDSFCSGKPLIVTDCAGHGPEIAYLRQGENAHITGCSIAEFANGVRRVLTDTAYRNRLIAGGLESARHYTIENMTQNFCGGIVRALDSSC